MPVDNATSLVVFDTDSRHDIVAVESKVGFCDGRCEISIGEVDSSVSNFDARPLVDLLFVAIEFRQDGRGGDYR